MSKIRLSLVSYINTIPFIEGIKSSPILSDKVELVLDYPAKCAEMILSGEVDGGLLPVGALSKEMEANVLSDYCIGADGFVRTVSLFSNQPLDEVDTVYLDYQSRTSVRLCKLIASQYWKRSFKYIDAKSGFETQVQDNEAVVIIGDRVFEYEHLFKYQVDLAQEWKEWTGLSFAFAVWVGNNKVKAIENEFNQAFKLGISMIPDLYNDLLTVDKNIFVEYLTEHISYPFDHRKKEGIQMFKNMLETCL